MLRSSFLLALIVVSACRCDAEPPPPRKALAPIPQKPLEGEAKEEADRMPKPTGTPVPADQLAKLLPDKVGTAHADGPTSTRTTPMANSGVMTAARRMYHYGKANLQVEVSDTLHAPAIRMLVERQVDVERSTEHASFSGTRIDGHPALVQWNARSSTAFINLLVDGRLLVNLRLEPAESPEPVVTLAQAFPYEPVAELAAKANAEHAAQEGATPNEEEEEAEEEEAEEEQGDSIQGKKPSASVREPTPSTPTAETAPTAE